MTFKKLDVKSMVLISLLIAINVVFTRILAIETPVMRFSFNFIPIALCAMMFGPIIGGVACVIADLIGMFLFAKTSFFIGFTFSTFLIGATYGFFLYGKPKTYINIAIAVVIVCLFINLTLETYWLKIILQKGYFALIPGRAIKSTITVFIQIPVIYLMWKYLGKYIKPFLN